MKKLLFQFVIVTFMFLLIGIPLPQEQTLAESSKETYSIDYEVLQGDSGSVSIANDYFEKPATLIVENGEQHIQITVNHSEWIKELQTPLGKSFVDMDIISENKDEDTQVVTFKVEQELSKPIEFKMHILIESMEPVYDHRYTAQFDFDDETMEKIENVKSNSETVDDGTTKDLAEKSQETQEKPAKTNQNTVVVSIIVLVVVAVLVILFLRKRTRSKK